MTVHGGEGYGFWIGIKALQIEPKGKSIFGFNGLEVKVGRNLTQEEPKGFSCDNIIYATLDGAQANLHEDARLYPHIYIAVRDEVK